MTVLRDHASKIKPSIFFCRLLLFVVVLLPYTHVAQQEWAKQMGGTEGDIGSCTAADLMGNIYTVGTFSGTSFFGTYSLTSEGKGDICIVKSNALDGTVIWAKKMGGLHEDNGNAIACDASGNVYLTGRYSGIVAFESFTLTSNGGSDSFLARLDPLTGTIVWIKKSGGTGNDGGLSLTTDAVGNIYTCGYFQGTATFGTFTVNPVGTNYNIFLTRTNPGGNVVWAKGYGSSGYSFGTSVSCDATGDVYMTGYFESVIAFGNYTLTAEQYQDIFVSKHYAATGNAAWVNSMGGQGNDNGNGIVAGSDGYVYVTGKFEGACAFGTTTLNSAGSADVFVSKWKPSDGAAVWALRFGSAGYEQGSAITEDAGHIYLAGQFSGFVSFENKMLSSNGNADAFLIKLKKDAGEVKWAVGMGGKNVDSGYGVCVGQDNAVFCTGFFQSNADLAGFELISNGTTDVFVLKLTSTTVGLEENSSLANSLQIMPQPFNSELTILINRQNLKPYRLSLSDVSGKVILELQGNDVSQHVNLEYLSAGIYLLTIDEQDGGRLTRRIIKN